MSRAEVNDPMVGIIKAVSVSIQGRGKIAMDAFMVMGSFVLCEVSCDIKSEQAHRLVKYAAHSHQTRWTVG